MGSAQIVKIFDTGVSFLPVDPNIPAARLPEDAAKKAYNQESQIPVFPYEGKDFLPTSYGYKSFFGVTSLLGIDSLTSTTQDLFIIQSAELKNILVALCNDGIWYKSGSSAGAWTHLVILAYTLGTLQEWTYVVLNRKVYCYRQGDSNFYELTISGSALVATTKTPSFLNISTQLGIFRAGGRLGFWDSSNSVSWSSIDNVEDFTPSTETLAGNSIFQDVVGNIVLIKTYKEGFIIYATKSIVVVNRQIDSMFLWETSSILTNNGIAYRRQVTVDNTGKVHFAYTPSGLFMISDGNISQVGTEFTDLLAGNAVPYYVKLLGGRYLYVEVLEENTILGRVAFTTKDIAESFYELPLANYTYSNSLPPLAYYESLSKTYNESLDALFRALYAAFLIGERVELPSDRVDFLSRWETVLGKFSYTSSLSTADWVETLRYEDLNYIDPANDSKPSTVYLTRKVGVNDPNMKDYLEEQITFWDDYKKAQAAKPAQILKYKNTVTLDNFQTYDVPEGGTPPVMGSGTWATTVEYEDIGNFLTGAGDLVFEQGFVSAVDEKKWQWIRLTKFFQQGFLVKKKIVTKYEIQSITPYAALPAQYTAPYNSNFSTQASPTVITGWTDAEVLANASATIEFIGDGTYFKCGFVNLPTTRAIHYSPDCNNGPDTSVYFRDHEVVPGGTLYIIRRIKDYSYVLETDPVNPDGTVFGYSTFTAEETYKDKITQYSNGDFDLLETTPFTGTMTLPALPTPEWNVSTVSFPASTYLLQDGSPAPYYPEVKGAFVYDLALKKWGSFNSPYKTLLDYSPINANLGNIVPVETFHTNMGALLSSGKICLFNEFSSQSYMKWGKIGLYRQGMTSPQEVKVHFRSTPIAALTVKTSLDGYAEEVLLEKTEEAITPLSVLYGGYSGRWHTLTVSGLYDITSIEFRGTIDSRR